MTVTKAQACKLAQELKDRNDAGESWRKIAACYGSPVKAGTLCRIAGELGEWLPKDRAILQALGLREVRRTSEYERRVKKSIRRMVRQTNDAVIRRKP